MPPVSAVPAKPVALRAVILGRAGYDLYSAEDGVPLDRVRRFTCGLGGSSANIAVGLARLGWRVRLAAALPDDAIGRFLRRRLAAEGIGLEALQTVAGRTASLCLTQIAPPQGAEQVFYRCHPADAALRWSPAIGAALRASRGGVFLTNGTSLCAAPSRAATRRGLRQARLAGLTTVLDVDYRASSWPSLAAAGRAAWAVLPAVDLVLANEEEARGLAAAAGCRGAVAMARAALARGVRVMVLKQGAKGAAAYAADGRWQVAAAAVAVQSTVGAGDGFAAGFLDAYGRGCSLEDSLRHGHGAAAWVVARVGCAEVMPYARQLRTALARDAAASRPGATSRSRAAHRAAAPSFPAGPGPLAPRAAPRAVQVPRAAVESRRLSAGRHP